MPTYTVRVNGRTSLVTDVLPHLFARLHDLRTAAGPVTVEKDGVEMTAHEVEELMLQYHSVPLAASMTLHSMLPTETAQEREWREGNEEAGPFNLTAAYGAPTETAESLLSEARELEVNAARKEALASQDWVKSKEALRRDAEIFREEAASKRRRAARLSGVASY